MADLYYCPDCGLIVTSTENCCAVATRPPLITFLCDPSFSREHKIDVLEEAVPFIGAATIRMYFCRRKVELPWAPNEDAPDDEWQAWCNQIIDAALTAVAEETP